VTARVVFDADITPRSRTAYEPALRYRRACAPEPRRFRKLAATTTPNPSTRPRPSLRLKCRPTRTLCIGALTLALCRARSAARGVPAGRGCPRTAESMSSFTPTGPRTTRNGPRLEPRTAPRLLQRPTLTTRCRAVSPPPSRWATGLSVPHLQLWSIVHGKWFPA